MFCSCRISTDKCLARSLYYSRATCWSMAVNIIDKLQFLSFIFAVLLSVTAHFITALCYAKRGICRRLVCVCVSVTLRYWMKKAKRRITQITPHDSPVTLVFWHRSFPRNSNGITPYGGDKYRWGGLKFVTFDEKCAITRKLYKIDA